MSVREHFLQVASDSSAVRSLRTVTSGERAIIVFLTEKVSS